MKKILVPCDLSECSMQAFRFAVDVAKKGNGEVHLLNVVELPVLYDSSAILAFEQAYMEDAMVSVDKQLRKMRDKIAPGFARVKTHIEFGSVQARIRNIIESAKIDVVIAGTHGAKGLKEFTVGSNAEKLVRTCDVPVIIVRKAPKSVENIVFPTLADMSQEDLTLRVKSLQEFFGAKLHLVYVNTPATFRTSGDIDKAFDRFAKRFMMKNFQFRVYNDLTEEAGIINFSKYIKADMVVMRTHGRRGIAHLAVGSIAEDVVNHIECPIVTLRIK
jgi:nucleotide-binding universal stress UspA family protein